MEPKAWVWPMRWQPAGGALARRGEGTFDSPSQSVPHAEVSKEGRLHCLDDFEQSNNTAMLPRFPTFPPPLSSVRALDVCV